MACGECNNSSLFFMLHNTELCAAYWNHSPVYEDIISARAVSLFRIINAKVSAESGKLWQCLHAEVARACVCARPAIGFKSVLSNCLLRVLLWTANTRKAWRGTNQRCWGDSFTAAVSRTHQAWSQTTAHKLLGNTLRSLPTAAVLIS